MGKETASSKKNSNPGITRVKSGCRTCKIRRVKCDEGKPVCQRCAQTGRVCDGYGIWGGGGRPFGPSGYRSGIIMPTSISSTTSTIYRLTQREQMSFDFFRIRTAQKLPGIFDSEFWETLVFQISLKEPAVLHAAIALGSAHRSEMLACSYIEQSSFDHEEDSDKNWSFALQQYNKAIASLQSHLKSTAIESLRVALMTCMIFICLELLRWNYKAGSVHLENGMRLLQGIRSLKYLNDSSTFVVNSRAESVDDHLIEAFTRLNVQSALFGQGSQYLYILPGESDSGPRYHIPSLFESVQEARHSIDNLLNGIFYLTESCQEARRNRAQLSTSLLQLQKRLRSGLSSWIQAYNNSILHLGSKINLRNTFGFAILRLFHTMATIMISTCVSPTPELAFDEYTSDFISIIVQTIEIAQKAARDLSYPPILTGYRRQPVSFTMDMGFLPALYFTALKCRVPRIRRQAIKLLLGSPHREGIWDGEFAARVADQVVRIEEGDLYNDLSMKMNFERFDIPSQEDLKLVSLPESSRVQDVRIQLPNEGIMNAILLYCFCNDDGTWEDRREELNHRTNWQ